MAAIRKFKFVFGGTHPAGNRFSRAAIQEQLYGFESFVDSVDQLSDEFVEKAAITLYEETLKLVPVDTGALYESGSAYTDETGSGKKKAVVTFGGVESPVTPTRNAPSGVVGYANIVNELHPTNSKFMERGAEAAIPKVKRMLVSILRRARADGRKSTTRRGTKKVRGK